MTDHLFSKQRYVFSKNATGFNRWDQSVAVSLSFKTHSR